MEIKILNIATILPFPKMEGEYKLKENDFLIILQKYLVSKKIDVNFVKISIWSNKIFARLSKKWDAYYKIPENYYVDGNRINVIKRIAFPKDKLKILSYILTLMLNMRKLDKIAKSNYTCSHAHYLLIDGYFSYYLYKRFNLPYVLTVRDETNKFKSMFLKGIAHRVLDNARYIITTNGVNEAKLKKFTDKDINIITHGVDVENFWYNSSVNDTIQIITVCKLDKGKRIDILLDALRKIKNIDYVLNIIGNGPEYDYLSLISEGVKCKFWGELKHEEVILHLKESDVFVLPSESESFGSVYIEALASSNAVIAVEGTGVYGLFEAEKEILYMKNNSVDSLYEILKDLLSNKTKIKNLKENGFRSVKDNYTWEHISDEYYKIYKEISDEQNT